MADKDRRFNTVWGAARMMGKRSGLEADEASAAPASTGERRHPASTARAKPKPTSMAPREGNKKKHYGKPFGKKGTS